MFNFAKKRINRLTEKARSGDLQAQYELGMNYSKGIDVHVNKALAWSWILESANGGFAEAQATISALILKDNIDDNLKLAEAFSYAQASANQGNGFGLAMLARFYGDGLVVEEDLDKALELYQISYYEKGFAKARISAQALQMYKFKKAIL